MGGWPPYAVMAGLMVVVAAVGIAATEIGPWYASLKKPSWQPPEWVFGPVWTTIYGFIIASFGLVWNAAPESARTTIVVVTAINLALNMAWSALFFKLRRPSWSLVEVVPLWLSIAAMMVVFHPHHALSAWLLSPYLLWVTIAAYLNLTIVRLNPGEV